MDCKFYVSLEAARLLKEKGYNEGVEMFYNDIGFLREVREFFEGWECLSNDRLYNNRLSAPSKAEAIDWLESKGIVIEIHYRTLTGKYFGEIHYNKVIYKDRPSDLTEDYKTRLEAKDATIIQALELL